MVGGLFGSRSRPLEGRVHDLYARALALQHNRGNRVVIVTTEMLGIPREMGEPIVIVLRGKTNPASQTGETSQCLTITFASHSNVPVHIS